MQLTILGAGTCVPAPQHSPAGYLVRIGATPLLIDAGPGTLARLAAAGVSYRDLEYVLITHLHPDHTLDLVTLFQALIATPGWKREQTLNLTGCPGFAAFVQALFDTFPGIEPRGYELTVSEMGEERRAFPAWTVQAALTRHTANSLAYRIEAEGRVLVYSGDAIESDALVRLAADADLFVCECALPNGWPPTNHLMAGAVGRLAQRAHVRQLVLTHLYPPALEADVIAQAQAEFAGPVVLGYDGLKLEV